MTTKKHPPIDPKAWAHRIVHRHGQGEKINATVLAMAQRALGLPTKE